ncbi:MAG: SRPBCC family protein [Deltaproteobacteria bacterium]
MPDIFHDFPIKVPPSRVFRAVTAPSELDQWWTARSTGEARLGAEYELWFGPTYDWRGKVARCQPEAEFELELTRADEEWLGTRVGFRLQATDGGTAVRFYHTGWPKQTEHYRISCYCWAMYLRALRRYLEQGERVPYERRLDA